MENLFRKYQIPDADQTIILKALSDLSFSCESDSLIEERLKSHKGLVLVGEQEEVLVGEQEDRLVLVREQENLLVDACRMGSIEFVKFLLAVGLSVNSCGERGRNCLHYAMRYFPNDAMRYFPHYRNGKCVDVIEERIELIKYLLDMGADYKKKDNENNTPIDRIPGYLAKDHKQKILDYIETMQLR